MEQHEFTALADVLLGFRCDSRNGDMRASIHCEKLIWDRLPESLRVKLLKQRRLNAIESESQNLEKNRTMLAAAEARQQELVGKGLPRVNNKRKMEHSRCQREITSVQCDIREHERALKAMREAIEQDVSIRVINL